MDRPSRKASVVAIELEDVAALEGSSSSPSSPRDLVTNGQSTSINNRNENSPGFETKRKSQEEDVQALDLAPEEPEPLIVLVGFTETLYRSKNFPVRDFDEVHVARDGEVLEIVLKNDVASMFRTYKSTTSPFTDISSLIYRPGQPDYAYAASEQQLRSYEEIMARICGEWEKITACLRAVLSGAGSRVFADQGTRIPRHLIRSLGNLAEASDKLQRDVIVLVDSCDSALEAVQSWGPRRKVSEGSSRLNPTGIEVVKPSTNINTIASAGELEQRLKRIEKRVRKIKLTVDLELVQTVNTLIQRSSNIISIDEAYHARKVGLSMKRLSWVTFIFLPLLFIASLYGMNVDVLKDNPSVWTYAVMAVCTFIAVMASVFIWKRREWFKEGFRKLRGHSQHSYKNIESSDEEMQDTEIQDEEMQAETSATSTGILNPPHPSKTSKAETGLFRYVGRNRLKRYVHHFFRDFSNRSGISRNPANADIIEVLFQAIRYGNEATVQSIISKNKDLLRAVHYNQKDPDTCYIPGFSGHLSRRTPITQAAFFGQTRLVRYFLELGVSVNSMDGDGCTALHCFALGKAPDIRLLRLLLDCRAVKVNSRQHNKPYGLTPLNFLLLLYGYTDNCKDSVWIKVSSESLDAGTSYQNILRFLLHHGAWLAHPPHVYVDQVPLVEHICKPTHWQRRTYMSFSESIINSQSDFDSLRSRIAMGLEIIAFIFDHGPEAASFDDLPSGWVSYKKNNHLNDRVCQDLVALLFERRYSFGHGLPDGVVELAFDSNKPFFEDFRSIENAWDRAVASQTEWTARTSSQRSSYAKDTEITPTPESERYMWNNNVLDGIFRHFVCVVSSYDREALGRSHGLPWPITKIANFIAKKSWNPSVLTYNFSRELVYKFLIRDNLELFQSPGWWAAAVIWHMHIKFEVKSGGGSDWGGCSFRSFFFKYADPMILENYSRHQFTFPYKYLFLQGAESPILLDTGIMMTPLIYIACMGCSRTTQILLELGADITARSRTNEDEPQDPALTLEWTALEWARFLRANPKERPVTNVVQDNAMDTSTSSLSSFYDYRTQECDEDYNATVKVLEEYEAKRQASLAATSTETPHTDSNPSGNPKVDSEAPSPSSDGILGGAYTQVTGGPASITALAEGSDGSGDGGLRGNGIGGMGGAVMRGAIPVALEEGGGPGGDGVGGGEVGAGGGDAGVGSSSGSG